MYFVFSDIRGKALDAKSFWGTNPMMTIINGKQFIATISKGDARILKDSEFDVSLHIPEGSVGVYKKCVHTDHSRIISDIPEEECIITPLVEIHHLESEYVEKEYRTFIIKLPHCIPERELWEQVKVRKWKNTQNGMVSQELIQKKAMGGDGDYFVMEEKFITVVTPHFCLVAGSICDREGCRRTLRIILMGKLESRLQKTSVWCSSNHSSAVVC